VQATNAKLLISQLVGRLIKLLVGPRFKWRDDHVACFNED